MCYAQSRFPIGRHFPHGISPNGSSRAGLFGFPPPKKIKDPELPFTFNWVAFPISQNSEVVFKANLEMQKIWIFLLKKPSFFLSISTFTQVIQQKKTTICYMTGNPYVIVHHLKILL